MKVDTILSSMSVILDHRRYFPGPKYLLINFVWISYEILKLQKVFESLHKLHTNLTQTSYKLE